jgi:carboxymethylenebutenolidase
LRFPVAVEQARVSFESAGKNVSADQFLPKSSKPAPIVIALHGSGGAPEDGGAEYAKALAGQSYIVLAPRYLERTGHTWAAPHEIEPNFKTWMDTVQDAMNYALSLPNNNGKLAVLGFSLGAYLALSVAAIDPRVHGVIDFFGGLPEVLAANLTHMPPVLILHGEQDSTVPISEAHKLQRLFDEKKITYEMKTYPGAGHSFHGADMMDAAQRTLGFLEKHVR